MHDQETIAFYDKESSHYSLKRYTAVVDSYTQYLFTTRLSIFLSFLKGVDSDLPPAPSLLEIGCADGVVMKAVESKFPGRFTHLVGVDIAPKMIEEAKRTNANPRSSFMMRNDLPPGIYNVAVELGLRIPDIAAELAYVRAHLEEGGYFFYSLIGRKSLHAKLKLKGEDYIHTLETYEAYERIIKEFFTIVDVKAYGLFVPKLWALPVLGQLCQPMIDAVCRSLVPELFHEKVYLLRNNTSGSRA